MTESKLLKNFRVCLSACSVLILATSCASGPSVTLCISDPPKNGFQCVDPQGKAFFLAYADSANYVAMSPDDTEHLFSWIKLKCTKQPD